MNSRLLDRISRDNSGQTEFVRPNEDIEASVARLYSKISAPVLTNMKIEFLVDGMTVDQGEPVNRLYPHNKTELFADNQLVIVGRYRHAGKTQVKMTGTVGNESREYLFDLQLAERGHSNRYPFISKLWAMRRIGEIIDLVDLHGKNDELINELVDLSLKHGIVTPYTSYLADENAGIRQLTDTRSNRARTGSSLDGLHHLAGDFAVEQRDIKNQMKAGELASNHGLFGGDMSAELGRGLGGAGRGGQGGRGGLPTAGIGGLPGDGTEVVSDNNWSGLRKVGDLTLYRRGNYVIAENAVDVDVEKDADKMIKVKRFSDEWFELTKTNSAFENTILAQQAADEELVVRLRDKIYLIQ